MALLTNNLIYSLQDILGKTFQVGEVELVHEPWSGEYRMRIREKDWKDYRKVEDAVDAAWEKNHENL